MGGGDVVIHAADLADTTVLHRAVLDHTQLCESCGRAGPCAYVARLKEMSEAAAEGRLKVTPAPTKDNKDAEQS